MSPIRRSTAVLAAAAALALAAPASALASTTITISGATASYPLVALLAAKYTKLVHNKVRFRITQGGTQVGINEVAAGRVTIGDVSRDPLATDPAGLDFYPIAKYAVCIVTNSVEHAHATSRPHRRSRSSPAASAAGAESPGASRLGQRST